MMLRIETFQNVRKHIFGLNAVDKVGDEVSNLKAGKVLIITDKGIVKSKLLNRVMDSLGGKSLEIAVFDEVKPEPTLESYEEALLFAKREKPDVIIGLGGGSSMDTAKTISMMMSNPGEIKQYVGPPFETFKKEGIPRILIPTTAGTGSECTQGSVIIVDSAKRDIADSKMFATVAIVDPMMTLSMPRRLTAITGIDALSHAIESFLSWKTTKLSYMFALEAIKLVFKYLRRAYRDGKDLEARYYMSLASTLAGMAISVTSTNLGHAIAYTFAGWHKLPHGLSCGIALPYIMEYYLPAVVDKLATIAKEVGIVPAETPEREAATTLIKSVHQLIKDLGLYTSLKEAGIPEDEIPEMINRLTSLYEYIWEGGPLPIIEDRIQTTYRRMWEGKLIE